MTGFRESEMVSICTDVHPNLVLPFPVHECSGYYDKNRPNWEQMEKLAIHVSPGEPKPRGFKVGSGFITKVTVGADEDDD
ncbi:hypothetical protein SAMN05421770_105199 [Granulicella rosea]|uniref:Uncharacterized protein n=1 Tax=Granulicella rosea TaxID=474952 RepID=A0A239KSW2_9BACT|nr:hypothetical protein [Granulicella rosea]SNT21436.1 hypothetical protein SAMN05421770_105199 [Granulicella rosea]